MNFTARYEVTAEFQKDFAKESYFLELRRQLPVSLVAWFLVAVGVASFTHGDRRWPLYAGSGLVAAHCALLAWSYFRLRAYCMSTLTVLSHPEVRITLLDSEIIYESSTGTRRFAWERIDLVKETKHFILLCHREVTLLGLPKSCFSLEGLQFVRSRGRHPSEVTQEPEILEDEDYWDDRA